uniref:calcium-dependent protein kinase 26-like n=1 Tax=Erigeron canadensis TaxID=72917 RepID=UPI001CB9C6B6|nr:calcium-dependent protein kinase 26-like [Erigeron canadensis]
MGNICCASKCLKHGFFGSMWYSSWWSKYEKRRARNHHHQVKNHKANRPKTPPRVVFIPQEEHKPAQQVQPVVPYNEVKEHGKQFGKSVIVKQQSKSTQRNAQSSVRHPKHRRIKSSAGLLVDKVLKTKTGFLKDHYTMGLKLGHGQFGTTSVCIDKKTGKQFACKSISKRKLVTEDDVEDVRKEVEIMHHLSGHPNVVTIEGAYEDAYEVHLIMELCAGGELFEKIAQKGHFTERKAADLLRTIASVIEACHSLGVVHRDLKPENFLFVDKDEDSPLKSIDFGLSVFFKPGEILTDIVGSPYYVAPEVLLKHYGSEIDIWSAGVILYILLSGVPPFWGETETDLFREILEGEIDFSFSPWPGISSSAKDLIQKMLIRDRSRRITAHEVLRHPWIRVDGVAPDKPLDPAVLTRLTQFSAMNKLKKMALRVIASKLSEEEIGGLKQMFKMIDTDNSGCITFDELKDGLKRFGADLDESEIHDLMQSADIDNSGTIDYDEFVAATLHFTKADREDRLFAAFSYFDKDASGYITRDELQKACKEFGVDDIHLEEIIKEVDQNNDGRIDYSEFVAMMHKGTASLVRNQTKNKFSTGFKEPLPVL